MDYQVVLEEFEGPLDLLLHLIKDKQMDLANLEVAKVCDQYVSYITQMQNQNLNILSEYLVMAANLLEMKSKLLLPKPTITLEGEFEQDPREALIRRLIEYKRYKDVLDQFKEKYESRQMMIIKPASTMEEFVVDTSTVIPDNLDVYLLIKAMRKMYQRLELSRPLQTHITRVDISIDQRCDQIADFFAKRPKRRVLLEELMEDDGSKINYVVTFLAVLVLCKDQIVTIEQEGLFEKLYVKGVDA